MREDSGLVLESTKPFEMLKTSNWRSLTDRHEQDSVTKVGSDGCSPDHML